MSPQLHPNGFRISDRPVAASFAHPYSFQPLPEYSIRDDACLWSSMSLGGVEGMWVRYWDEASTAVVLEFKVEEPVKPTIAAPVIKEKKEKKKKGSSLVLFTRQFPGTEYLASDPAAQSTSGPSALPVSDKPVTLSFKGGFSMNKPGQPGASKKAVPLSQAFSMDEAGEGDADPTTSDATATEDPKGLSGCWETNACASWLTVYRLV